MTSVPPRSTFSTDPNRLAPEDAFLPYSPPRERSGRASANGFASETSSVTGVNGNGLHKDNGSTSSRPRRQRGRSRSSRRGEGRQWKKLLWIKQPYPDNYTDASTFLSHLQRNPRLQAYDFWPLVADSTVIVQHICAVAIFVCCFVAIYQERVSPVSVVGTATACSFVGWIMWDIWLGADEQEKERAMTLAAEESKASPVLADSEVPSTSVPASTVGTPCLGISTPASYQASSMHSSKLQSRNQSSTSLAASAIWPSLAQSGLHTPALSQQFHPAYTPPASSWLSPRNQQRLATAKSALLIYFALLGLSPILKSLTLSTTSDSIWAMSCWLILTNIFTFDYGGSEESPKSRFPASLSTNAALMASTVLASRLPSATHVFSLTLFSIEVFGLFPVFRRYLRHKSFALHGVLTFLLIVTSGALLGTTLIGGNVWKASTIGVFVWGFGTVVGMGGCSWWLIGLQRYKDVVIGPWDPARPIIRAGAWD